MRKIIFVLLFAVLLGTVFSAAPAINQVNYNPSPAVPGSTTEILVQVENTENITKTNVIVSINDDYPFTLKSDSEVNVGSLAKHAKTTVSFTVYVDPSAENATYPLNISVGSDQDGVARLVSSNIVISGREAIIKVVGASNAKMIPGEEKTIDISLQNVGTSAAYDVVLEFIEDRTVTATGTVVEREILPLGSASTFVGTLLPGATTSVPVNLTVNREAELQNYTVPVTVSYRTSSGERTSNTSYVGFKVSGDVQIEATLKDVVGTTALGSDNIITIEIFNKGAGKADFVIASLGADCGTTDGSKEFIGTLEPNDVDSFRSVLTIQDEYVENCVLSVNMEYQDSDATTKSVSIPLALSLSPNAVVGGGPDIVTIAIVIVVLIAGIWYIRKRKGKK